MTQDESTQRQSSASTWLVAVLLLLAIVPYINTLQNGYVFDDHNEVLTNPYIRSFSHLGDIFSTRILAHLGARGVTNYYRPISILGFLICYQLFGLLPYGFHLANVLVHGLIVYLLFGLTRRLFGDQWLAFAATAVFALHPIHTESVAWISGVTDLELALFYLAAFWFFVAGARPQGGRSEWMQVGMCGCFVLALLSKEQAATLALTALIYEHFYRGDRDRTTVRQKLSRYGNLWLLLVVYLLFRIRFFGAFAPVQLTHGVSWYQAFLSAAALTGTYLWKMLWPVHLLAFYPFHKSVSPFDLHVLAGVVSLGICALAFWGMWRRAHRVSFGIAWFFINLAPVLNSRWLGPNVFTERYLYLPSIGLCWVAGWAIVRIWKGAVSEAGPRVDHPMGFRGRQVVLAGVLVLAASLAVIRIYTRNRDWRDDETYYRVTLAAEPEAEGLRLNLGAVYWNRMQPEAAEIEWKRALKVMPDSALLMNNLGLASARRQKNDEAIGYFQRAIRLKPNYTDPHLNLGRLYEGSDNRADAELQLRAAVALAPLSVEARNELGKFYLAAGRRQEAEAQFQASVESIPNPAAYDSLGDINLQQGRREAAEQAYLKAIGLDAFDFRGHFGLASILAAQGHANEAVDHYRMGLSVDPRNPEAQAAVQRLTTNSSHDTRKNR